MTQDKKRAMAKCVKVRCKLARTAMLEHAGQLCCSVRIKHNLSPVWQSVFLLLCQVVQSASRPATQTLDAHQNLSQTKHSCATCRKEHSEPLAITLRQDRLHSILHACLSMRFPLMIVCHRLMIMQAQRALQQLQQQQQQQQQSSPAVRGSSPQRSQELPDYYSEPAAPQRHYAMHVSVGLAALCAWWYYLQDVPALERKLLSVLLTPVSDWHNCHRFVCDIVDLVMHSRCHALLFDMPLLKHVSMDCST